MKEDKEVSYFAIIPANVRYDKELTANAKLLYGEISALTHKEGYCYASNNYFAELYSVTPQAISKWVKLLEDKGYVKIVYLYNGLETKERRIYMQETVSQEPKKEVSTEIKVSTNDEEGINKGLKGYQQKVKDNNTQESIQANNTNSSPQPSESSFKPFEPQEENSNSHSVSNADYNKKNKKTKKETVSFKQEEYTQVFNAYFENCKTLFQQGKITVEEPVIPVTHIKKIIKLRFLDYGVDKVLQAVKDSVNNFWLVTKTNYSITALFSEKVIADIINGTCNSGFNKPAYQKTSSQRQWSDEHLIF